MLLRLLRAMLPRCCRCYAIDSCRRLPQIRRLRGAPRALPHIRHADVAAEPPPPMLPPRHTRHCLFLLPYAAAASRYDSVIRHAPLKMMLRVMRVSMFTLRITLFASCRYAIATLRHVALRIRAAAR